MAKNYDSFLRKRGQDIKVVGTRGLAGAAVGFAASKGVNYVFDVLQEKLIDFAGELDKKISDSVNNYVDLDSKVTEKVESVPLGKEMIGLDKKVKDVWEKGFKMILGGEEVEEINSSETSAEIQEKKPYDCHATRDFVVNHDVSNIDVTLPLVAAIAGYGTYKGLKKMVKHRVGNGVSGIREKIEKVFGYSPNQ